MNVKFRKSTLLRFDGWGPMKQEIYSLPDEIEVVTTVSGFWKSLDRINKVLIEDDKADFYKAAESIQQLITEIDPTRQALSSFESLTMAK